MFLFELLNQRPWLTWTLFGISFCWVVRKLIDKIKISDFKHKAVFITNCDDEIGQEIMLKCARHGFRVYAGFSGSEVSVRIFVECSRCLESIYFGNTGTTEWNSFDSGPPRHERRTNDHPSSGVRQKRFTGKHKAMGTHQHAKWTQEPRSSAIRRVSTCCNGGD